MAKLAGNRLCQFLLDKNLELTRFLQGVDSGTWVETSGEFKAVSKAVELGTKPYCIFDVGANKGQFISVLLGTLPLQSDVTIHSFEPSKYTFKLLQDQYGDHPKIKLHNIGMAGQAGEMVLYSDGPGSGRASLTQRNLSHEGIAFEEEEVIRVSAIDTYCAEHGIEKIDLLKIDVEGHELDVLAGAEDMLSRKKINVVCFEFSSCNVDTKTFIRDFFELFTRYNMSLYRITASGYLKPLPVYRETYEQFGDSNYIALRGDG